MSSRLRERSKACAPDRSSLARNEKQAELMQQKLSVKRSEKSSAWSQQGQLSSRADILEVDVYQHRPVHEELVAIALAQP